jgi:hypothetical protein
LIRLFVIPGWHNILLLSRAIMELIITFRHQQNGMTSSSRT